jgi:NAD(P)-dependent dehydrogenase (short-subunit alcohol dehydrogenase family)
MKVQNKVIVATGGGSGIGRELVLNLLSKNASVAAVDINESALQETLELAGNRNDNLSTHLVDITDKDSMAELPEQVISKHGTVDGIINNAGIIQPFVRLEDLEYAAIERVMSVDFYGTLYMTKAFLPPPPRTPRSAHSQYIEHGWIPASTRPKRVRGSKGSRQAVNRRIAL